MRVLGWIWRIVAVLVGALLALRVITFDAELFTGARHASPYEASAIFWDVWFVSWLAASLWSRPAVTRPALFDQIFYWTPTIIGFVLLAYGSARPTGVAALDIPLWHLPRDVSWALTGVCAAGLLFTWWARVSLGGFWSGGVSRKEDHAVIQSGPYGLVRHPIYTGLIVAAFALAAQVSMPANMLGAVLMSMGFWLKARLEERFLSNGLGANAYADYRRRTPMLIPLWPLH